MTDWLAPAQKYLDELTGKPAARSPATFTEIWQSEWARSGLDTLTGVGRPRAEAERELTEAIEAAGGAPVHEIARRSGVDIHRWRNNDERIGLIASLADTLPEEERKKIEPLRDVRKRAAEKAQRIEKEAADVAGATYGLGGAATAFTAGIARQAVDPVNLATMGLGNPFAGGVVKMLGREFLIGAGTQAVQEPTIQAGRAELGLESGFGRGAGNVLEAGIGAAGLAGLFRGGAAALRAMRGTARAVDEISPVASPESAVQAERMGEPPGATGPIQGPVDAPLAAGFRGIDEAATSRPVSDIPAPFRELAPDDLDAAAMRAERDDLIHGADVSRFTQTGYHGTNEIIERFDADKTRLGRGVFFAEDPKLAERFATNSATDSDPVRFWDDSDFLPVMRGLLSDAEYRALEPKHKELMELVERHRDDFPEAVQKRFDKLVNEVTETAQRASAFMRYGAEGDPTPTATPNTTKVRIDPGRQMTHDMGGRFDWDKELEGIVKARDGGYDTLRLTNVGEEGDILVVFDPNKSVINEFDAARLEAAARAIEGGQPLDDAAGARPPAPEPVERPAPPEPGHDQLPPPPRERPEGAPPPLGDPALARDAELTMASHPDLEIMLPDGRKVPARRALSEAREDEKAVHEYLDCLGKKP